MMQRVLVFGMGKLYRDKKEYIRKNFEIAGFLDNKAADDTGGGHQEEGIPVYNPKGVSRCLEEDIKIALMSCQYVQMWRQLKDLGIGGDRILFGIAFPPYSESEKALYGMGRVAIDGNGVAYVRNDGEKTAIQSHGQLQEMANRCLRDEYKKKYPMIDAIAKMGTSPSSRIFGLERGTAVDRHYIERFLEKNRKLIRGDCLEIAEDTYTLRYGEDRVDNAYILHVKGWGGNAIKGNLETGEGIDADRYDCAIITQTLMYTFDLKRAAGNIHKMLKRNGTALITVSGIGQVSRYDADLWGSYYGFHEDAAKALFEPLFGRENVSVHTYGNVKTAMAALYGMCREELAEEDFNADDRDYPVIISAVLTKI